MTTLFKRSGRSSPEEGSLTASPLKSAAAAAAATSSLLSANRTPNNNNIINTTPLSNSSPTKKPASSKKSSPSSSRGITIMKYIFLSILILLVYFLLQLNLNLIKRLEVQNDKHTTAAAAANDGGSISGSVAAVSSSANTIDTAGNTRGNLAAVDNNNDEDMEILQKRLVTLQNEVAIMQKKVEGARQKVDLIKKNGVSAAAADSKNGAGKGVGVVSVTSSSQNKMKELPRHTCTPAETAKQTTRLQKRFQEWWSHSACPDQVWMEHIDVLFDEVTKFDSSLHSRPQQQQEQKQQQQPFLILDIGCNKGYTSADFFDTLSPGTNMNPKTLVGAIRSIASEDNIKIDRDGGVCNDSNKALNKDRDTVRDVEVHCFEPSPATYEMLNRAHVKLMSKNNKSALGNNNVVNGMTISGTNWYIHNKGLHNTNGKMMWHKACGTAIGDELCTIVDEGTEDAIVVPVVTVDKFMEETFTVAAAGGDEQQLPLVHMLKIDAEGLDPAVLQGSTNLLTANRAIMVMFEFNPGLSEKGDTPHGMWGKRGNPHVTLLDVTNWLDTLGYDCYLDTHLPDEREMKKGVLDAPALYRITGDCLNREPSVRGWANVVCAARKYGSVAERLLKLATIVKP